MLGPMASRAQGTETRARLVRAATEAFAERGVRETSLTSVAAAAGVTRQGLLHYFPSKTDLLLAVLEQRDEDDAATVTPAVAAGGLTGALLAIMDHNRDNPGLTQLFAVSAAEGARTGDPAHEYFRERYERRRGEMAVAIRQLQTDGNIATDLDAELISAALLALLYGLNLQHLTDPELDHAAALAGILRLVINDDVPDRPRHGVVVDRVNVSVLS